MKCEPVRCKPWPMQTSAIGNMNSSVLSSMASPCPCVHTLCLAHCKLLRCTVLSKREVYSELVCGKSPRCDAKAQLVRDIYIYIYRCDAKAQLVRDTSLRYLIFLLVSLFALFVMRTVFLSTLSEVRTLERGIRVWEDHFIPQFASVISNQISDAYLPTRRVDVIRVQWNVNTRLQYVCVASTSWVVKVDKVDIYKGDKAKCQ